MAVPPFSLTEPRYDGDSFWGRTQHFYEMTDMFTLQTTEAELHRCRDLLKAFEAGVSHAMESHVPIQHFTGVAFLLI